MPQFDLYSFSGQVFWTLTGFYLFYFFNLYFYLTKFSTIIKIRQKLIITYLKEEKIKSNALNSFNFFKL